MVVAPTDRTFDSSADSPSNTMECIVRGRPQEEVETLWLKDGATIRARHVLTSWNRTLTVLDVGALGQGNITCKASLRSDPETHPVIAWATVTLAAPPTLVHKVAEETAAELGQSVILPCSAVGMPLPQVRWLRNAQPLRHHVNFIQLNNGSLLIEELAAEDAGVFQCVASNELGEVLTTTWLHIKISPPSFVRAPENVTVLDGMDAQLTCGVVGSPTPNTTWLYNGVVPLQSEGRIQIMDNGNLLLASVTTSDSGEYSCTRANSAGSVSSSAYLTVLVRTQIVQPPVDTRVILGSTAELQCKVSHDPSVPFTIRWLPEGIASSRIAVAPDGTLRIEQARNTDIGTYTCVVTSPGGNDTRSARLQVIELPHPPTNVLATVQDTLPKTVRVSWSPAFDGNSPISHFILQMRSLSNVAVDSLAPWTTARSNISASATSVLVPQLNPSVSYQFRLSAVNGVGEGAASEPTHPISVPPEPPGGPPQGVVGAARSSISIMLQWQPPLEGERNGQLLGYTVRYKLAGYAPVPWATLNVTATTTLLSDLIVWQTYAIQVAAFNEKGLGVFSEPITVRTREGVPRAAPTDVKTYSINSTSVHVQWMPPDPQLIDGLNQGYKVEAWDEGEVQRVVLVPPNPTAPLEEHVAVVPGLRKYRKYNITVLCFTSPGDGPRSFPVLVTTKQDVPGPVQGLKFEDILDVSTVVLWAPPEEVNGVLLGYTLRYWIRDNPDSTIVRNVTADVTREYVGGLKPVTFYVFEVSAWTVIGAGPPLSATIQSGIPPVLPGAPRRLAVSNIGAFSVVLQFTPGFDGNSSITKWTVEAQTRRSERWTVCYHEENAPEAQALTVQPLVPYTEYRLRLTASNVVGESPFSEPSHWFQTLQAAPGHAPRNVTVRAAGPHSLRVRWTPLPQGEWHGVPRGYNISYRAIGEEEFSWAVMEDHNSNSLVVDQLHAFTQYQVFMQAINDVGASAHSALATERTREYTPTAGPSNVVANATSSTTVVVSWMDVPFAHRNGIIEGYRVVYRAAKASETTQRNIEGNATFAVTLTELRKYTQYTVQVLAFTRVGDGVLSIPPVTVTTFQDVPGPPSNVSFPDVTTTTARIIWDVPEEPNGEITAYRIAYWPNGTHSLRVEREVSPLDRTLKAFDLTPQTYYMFVVSAKTHEGWGLEARALVLTTAHREKPSPPSKPLVSPSQVQARQMTFSWTPGRDGFAPLRYYVLQLIEGDGPWRDVGKVEPGATTHTAVGLRPATRYQFRLRALNDLGASPWSEPSQEMSTHPAAPGQPPSSIVVTPYTTTSITVAWKGLPKEAWNGDSLNAGYRVEYCPAGEARDCQSQQLLGHNSATLTIDGLERDRIYEVRVRAFNGQGEGPPSGPITVYVGEAVPTGRPRKVQLQALSSTEVNVTWLPPLKHESNGELLGYKIFYWDINDEEELEAVPAEPTVYTLSGLKKFVNYTVQLLAFNPAGDGPRSEHTAICTLPDKPGPVGALRFSDIRMTSLNLSWEMPEEPNGIIAGYLVNYETTELNAESGKEVRQKVLQQHLWVGSLREMATYRFSVRAKTSAGYGPERRRNVTTGPQDGSPLAPLEFALQHSVTSATLSWTEGLPGASPITGYLVEARSVPHLGDEWQTIAELPPQLSYTVSYQNLVPSTKYEFRLFARNHFGVSPPVYTADYVETPNKLFLEYRQRLPFHREPWFLVVLAASSMVLIILLIAVLCVKSKAHRYKKEMEENLVQRQESDPLGEGEVAGFGTPAGSMSKRNARRPPLRSPPRPSPASITYSDEEDAKGYDDHCDSSSITEKPSEISSSESQGSDSDSDTKGDPHSFVNHYANVNDTLRQSWKKQNIAKPPSYTDSEQDSAAAVSLNGGKIVLNNMAGSRAPLPGFSSFV
ncbi:protein sidekick-like isoform X1 [Ornithodoros turicata]